MESRLKQINVTSREGGTTKSKGKVDGLRWLSNPRPPYLCSITLRWLSNPWPPYLCSITRTNGLWRPTPSATSFHLVSISFVTMLVLLPALVEESCQGTGLLRLHLPASLESSLAHLIHVRTLRTKSGLGMLAPEIFAVELFFT